MGFFSVLFVLVFVNQSLADVDIIDPSKASEDQKQKRFLVQGILQDIVHGLEDGAKIAGCEATLDKNICISCCDHEDFSLPEIEKPACHAACSILHKKRDASDLLGSIGSDAGQIARCELTGNQDACTACCNEANFGLLAAIEKPVCVTACSILGKKRELLQKRFLVKDILTDVFHGLEDGAKLAGCEATLDKTVCASCCDTEDFSVPEIEKPACHAACSILGRKRELNEQRRGVLNQLTQDTAQILQCEATLSRSACEACCQAADWGLGLDKVELTACTTACKILPSKKRGLVKDTNNKASLQKDTIENLKCEQKANQADCQACCQWGATYLQTDLATCGATCSTLPAVTKPTATKPPTES